MKLGPVVAPLLAWVIRGHIKRLVLTLNEVEARWTDPAGVGFDGYWVLVRDLEVLQTLLDDLAVLVADPELPANVLGAINDRGVERARLAAEAVRTKNAREQSQ